MSIIQLLAACLTLLTSERPLLVSTYCCCWPAGRWVGVSVRRLNCFGGDVVGRRNQPYQGLTRSLSSIPVLGFGSCKRLKCGWGCTSSPLRGSPANKCRCLHGGSKACRAVNRDQEQLSKVPPFKNNTRLLVRAALAILLPTVVIQVLLFKFQPLYADSVHQNRLDFQSPPALAAPHAAIPSTIEARGFVPSGSCSALTKRRHYAELSASTDAFTHA